MWAFMAPGLVKGPKRSATIPFRSTKNFVKFHFTASMPRKPGFDLFRNAKSGCVALPFTSIFSKSGKVTLKVDEQYC